MPSASRMIPMLSIADLSRALRFYGEALGGREIYRFPPDGEPAFVTLQFGTTELGLGVIDGTPLHGQPLRPATGHRIELCFNVESVPHVVAALAAVGAMVVTPPTDQPWGETSAYVEDPEGNLVMLVAPTA